MWETDKDLLRAQFSELIYINIISELQNFRMCCYIVFVRNVAASDYTQGKGSWELCFYLV